MQYDLKRGPEAAAVETAEIGGVPLSWFVPLQFNLDSNPIRIVEEHIAELKPAVGARRGLMLSACRRAVAGVAQCYGCALRLVARASRLGNHNSCGRAPPSRARVWCECRRTGWYQSSDVGRRRRSLKVDTPRQKQRRRYRPKYSSHRSRSFHQPSPCRPRLTVKLTCCRLLLPRTCLHGIRSSARKLGSGPAIAARCGGCWACSSQTEPLRV